MSKLSLYSNSTSSFIGDIVRPQKKDQVFVEKAEIFEDLLHDLPRASRSRGFGTKKQLTSPTMPISRPVNSSAATKVGNSRLTIDEAEMKRMIETQIMNKKAKDDEKFFKLLDDIDKSTSLLRQVDKTLQTHDYMEQVLAPSPSPRS
jgi:hypothetical protein